MLQTNRSTLTQFLIEERRRFPQASGDFNALILDVTLACKAIARTVAYGELGGAMGNHAPEDGGSVNVQGETQKKLDMLSNELFLQRTEWSVHLAGMASEEMDLPHQIPAQYPRGPYLLVFDPLDGSSNIDVNVSVGSIFSVLRAPKEVINSRFWEAPVKRYVDECLAGKTGVRGKDFNMRWIASMVAEAHRILMRGGVFMYPRDTKDPLKPGRLRLLYEANPVGMLMEQAGGRASTGREPMLTVQPSSLHQRIGLVFGSKNEVERIERYHREPAQAKEGEPLFASRSLFRD